jgi:hypothetical protein
MEFRAGSLQEFPLLPSTLVKGIARKCEGDPCVAVDERRLAFAASGLVVNGVVSSREHFENRNDLNVPARTEQRGRILRARNCPDG